MIVCKELNKTFPTKKEMFKELQSRKTELIDLKKSAIKYSDGLPLFTPKTATKAAGSRQLQYGDIVSNVINTTLYLDSHNDVHLNGIWNQTVKQQAGNVFHVINHDLSIGSIVGYKNDVTMEVRKVSWRSLGYDVDGMTEALIFHTKITDKTNVDAFKAYRDNAPVQHSIRMEYVKLMLAIDDEEMEEEYKVFQSYLPQVINRSTAEERGYFWVIQEAKISKEGSTVVFGSNDITPYLGFETGMSPEPPISTLEPALDFDLGKAIQNIKFFN